MEIAAPEKPRNENPFSNACHGAIALLSIEEEDALL
jgi:hypothetical protein